MESASNSRTPRFQTLFVDQDPDVVNALAASFARKWPTFVRFTVGNIFRSGPGILVTPTNSEGDMSGGLDLQLRSMFPGLEERLQSYIRTLRSKRLKIESSVWIETGNGDYPFVIFSPTFRTGWDLATPNRVYRAALAVFGSAQAYGSVSTVHQLLVPGFGTGVGGLDPSVSSRRVFQAYCRAIETPIEMPPTPVVPELH
jgi:O-acetyl-ADP-ribose deacetylase (regulator of RNase III)